ncbi:TPA: LTA synthase family protein, partial [Streptococcus suis]
MKKLIDYVKKSGQTRLGFVLILLIIYWLKTLWAYYVDFNLDTQGVFQNFIAIMNPLPVGILLLGLSLYIKNTKVFYSVAMIIYIILSVWLFSNAVYYREFSDYISISTIMATSSVSAGLGEAALKLFRLWDIVYFLDFIIFGILVYRKLLRWDKKTFHKKSSFAITALSVMLFSINLFLAEIDRPELLTRGFSNTYIVRALGLPAFLGYNANQTYNAHKNRSGASATDLEPVKQYITEHYAQPNDNYFGIAKGRNVIYLHLESLQQFVIDYKLNVNGVEHEVT